MPVDLGFRAEIPKGLGDFIRAVPRHAAVKVIKPAVMAALKHPMRHYKATLKKLPWSKGKTHDPPHNPGGSSNPPKPMFSVIGVSAVHYRNGNVFGVMGPRSGERIHHAWLVENGAKPHKITAGTFRGRPTGRKLLIAPPPFGRPRKIGRFNTLGRSVRHEGTKAGGHLVASAKARKGPMEHTFIKTAKSRVNIVLRSLAKQKVRRVIIGQLRDAGISHGKVTIN